MPRSHRISSTSFLWSMILLNVVGNELLLCFRIAKIWEQSISNINSPTQIWRISRLPRPIEISSNSMSINLFMFILPSITLVLWWRRFWTHRLVCKIYHTYSITWSFACVWNGEIIVGIRRIKHDPACFTWIQKHLFSGSLTCEITKLWWYFIFFGSSSNQLCSPSHKQQ